VEKELEADSRFQVVLKDFRTAFGIENLDYINTERREILAISIHIDAVVTFPDDFDFTILFKRLFPWLGKMNVFIGGGGVGVRVREIDILLPNPPSRTLPPIMRVQRKV